MRFSFDDEQAMFQDAMRGILTRDIPVSQVRIWTEKNDLETFDSFALEQGWLGLGASEEVGGQGGGIVELAIFFEEIGRATVPSGKLHTVIGSVVPLLSQLTGGAELLSEVIAGSTALALAIPAGMPLDSPFNNTVSEKNGRLSGSVSLVLEAPRASHLLVPVQKEGKCSFWLVDATSEGVSISHRNLIDKTRCYGDVDLVKAVGKPLGDISNVAAASLAARGAILVAAESLGLARKMLEMTTEYVCERKQFGVPVGSFQAVKHAAAMVLVDIEASHSGVYYAAWALENNAPDALVHAWIAKAFATQMAATAADRALFLHGAIGYTWEFDLHFYFKRAKANLELLGSPKKYYERIADYIKQQQGNV